MRSGKGLIAGALRALVAAVLIGVIVAPVGTAHAVQTLSVPEADQASDPVTVVEVSKLSFAEGHPAVAGAVLQIIEESTGDVVYQWTTDGSTVTINRSVYYNGERVNLNLNTPYILREVSCPLGYSVIPSDVRFEITGIYTSDVSLSGDADGHATLTGAHHITIYDSSTNEPDYVDDIEYIHQPNTVTTVDTTEEEETTEPENPLERLAQTGDLGLLWPILLAAAGLSFVALSLRTRRLA